MTLPDFPVVIYHNPACGTSRNAIAMARAAGYAPSVVEYLTAGWSPGQLEVLMSEAGVRPREWLREKGTPAAAMGLLDPGVSDAAILKAMVEAPILVNRPIVVTPLGVKLCRPSEVILTLLERRPESFVKEDGEVVRLS